MKSFFRHFTSTPLLLSLTSTIPPRRTPHSRSWPHPGNSSLLDKGLPEPALLPQLFSSQHLCQKGIEKQQIIIPSLQSEAVSGHFFPLTGLRRLVWLGVTAYSKVEERPLMELMSLKIWQGGFHLLWCWNVIPVIVNGIYAYKLWAD